GVVEPTEEAQLVTERAERLGGLAKDELAVFLSAREPAPFVELVLFARQRHAVGGVDRAEAPRNLVGHFGAHGVEHRQRESHAAHASYKGSPVEFEGMCHGSLRLLLEKRIAMDDETDHILHPIAAG